MRRWAVLRSGSMKALYMGYTVSDICSSSSSLQAAVCMSETAGTPDAAGQGNSNSMALIPYKQDLHVSLQDELMPCSSLTEGQLCCGRCLPLLTC